MKCLRMAMLSLALLVYGTMWAQPLNVSAKVGDAERVGFHVWLTYTLTNNTTADLWVSLKNGKTMAYGDDGSKYNVFFMHSNKMLDPDFASLNLPAGIPVKVVMMAANVPEEVKSLAKVGLHVAAPGNREKVFSNTNFPIKELAPNSDNPETVFNYPWVNIKTKGCKRVKGEPTQYFMLNSPKEVTVEITGAKAYDEDGNSYEAYVGTGVDYFTIQAGIPLEVSVSVKNVPEGVNKLLAIKVDLRINGPRYLLQFNNVEITAPQKVADDRALFDLKGNVRECKVTFNGAVQTYTFGKDGEWTGWNGMDMKESFPGGIERDTEGRITEGKRDQYGEYFHRYTYDDKGRVRTAHFCEDMEGGYIETYRRSFEGEVIRIDRRGGFDPDGNPTVTLCTIVTRDAQGNWTKRKRGTAIETRTITYY